MTREKAEKIVKGITDKIECNTADIDDWAKFWGFTREDYEEFLDMAIKTSEQRKGHWIRELIETENDDIRISYKCSECEVNQPFEENFCPNCGAKMKNEEKE